MGGAWAGWMVYGGPSGAVYGILVTCVLFGSLVLHEIAHGVLAHKLGLAVSRMTFLPIGILLEIPPSSARHEIMIAAVGPLANLGTALALGLFTYPSIGHDTLSVASLVELLLTPGLKGILIFAVMMNAFLGLFNMFPAFPMDGGRVLRAALALTLDYAIATQIAARVGQALAIVMGLAGLIGFPLVGLPVEPALVVVAGVVFFGARHEELYVRQQRALVCMEVRDVYKPSFDTLSPWDAVTRALAVRLFKQEQVLPVVIEDKLVGLLTDQEIRNALGQDHPVSIAHIMRTDFPTLQLQDTLWVALRVMNASRLARLPVVHEGVLQGTVSLDDIDRAWRLLPLRHDGQTRPPVRR
jgi:Zn-dependent protease/predicted transcriptional regulator